MKSEGDADDKQRWRDSKIEVRPALFSSACARVERVASKLESDIIVTFQYISFYNVSIDLRDGRSLDKCCTYDCRGLTKSQVSEKLKVTEVADPE